MSPQGKPARAWVPMRWLRRGWRAEAGTATTEFVIIFPLFIAILLTAVETGIHMSRNVMLERAVDLTVRDLRLGSWEQPTPADLRQRICERASIIRSCEETLLLELHQVDASTWDGLTLGVSCMNRETDFFPVTEFRPGTTNDLMLLRACVIADPIMPVNSLMLTMPRDPSGGYRVAAVSAFVNEPR